MNIIALSSHYQIHFSELFALTLSPLNFVRDGREGEKSRLWFCCVDSFALTNNREYEVCGTVIMGFLSILTSWRCSASRLILTSLFQCPLFRPTPKQDKQTCVNSVPFSRHGGGAVKAPHTAPLNTHATENHARKYPRVSLPQPPAFLLASEHFLDV